LSFDVSGQASVDSRCLSIDPLQHEALVAHDDPGAAVLLQGAALYFDFKNSSFFLLLFYFSAFLFFDSMPCDGNI
jgi:hypothetical protein